MKKKERYKESSGWNSEDNPACIHPSNNLGAYPDDPVIIINHRL